MLDVGLEGRRVLITGASRGIGRAIALEFARQGAYCAISARTEGALRQAATDLSADAGRPVVPIAADFGVRGEGRRVVEQTVRQLGGLDVLVNNAASVAAHVPDAAMVDEEVLLRQFEVKAVGYLECAQAACQPMISAGWGRIVNIAGIASRKSGDMASGMRNAAIINMTKQLSVSLGPHGITVNAVSPGQIDTSSMRERMTFEGEQSGRSLEEMRAAASAEIAIRRMVTPEDIAHAVLWIASTQMSALTGQVIAVDGGLGEWIYY